ncbi:hypothetical protein LPTSP4_16360 [Leptospira ryugenii]|uniref:CAAX prenyl protease 2/Lysostaphin resistance protein A-like domain-containing protein n=1 Tax=Leptospira ryugenii TaxID=1917863 RepID=A0A2P2DZQ3_9LEPT|nr:CPBP family intramembrane glutamic endopeptidase [Leptospira ryugenii]GBF50112.1 hypothetical protein LPTSP4_16360 [Leptospira ryugenii]
MNIYRKFSHFFLFGIALSLLLSAILYGMQMYFISLHSGEGLKPFTFSKILSRTATIVLFVSMVWFRKRVDQKSIISLGLSNFSQNKHYLMKGFLAGIVSLSLVVIVQLLVGASTWNPKAWGTFETIKFVYILFVVLLIGLVEELFFRGFLLQAWINELGTKKGALYTSLFFSLTHFIRPIHDPLLLIPEFIGLFLVGYALSLAFIYTKSLYLPIGIHAGWVFVAKMESQFVDRIPYEMHWVFGGERLVTSAIAWVFMALFLLFLKKSYDVNQNKMNWSLY